MKYDEFLIEFHGKHRSDEEDLAMILKFADESKARKHARDSANADLETENAVLREQVLDIKEKIREIYKEKGLSDNVCK